jgi:hypothetical protein
LRNTNESFTFLGNLTKLFVNFFCMIHHHWHYNVITPSFVIVEIIFTKKTSRGFNNCNMSWIYCPFNWWDLPHQVLSPICIIFLLFCQKAKISICEKQYLSYGWLYTHKYIAYQFTHKKKFIASKKIATMCQFISGTCH